MAVVFAVPSLWTPSSLPNLVAWHKADVGLSLSGSQVTSWADQSGSSRTLSPGTGSTTGPTYQATGYNSKPTISFDGSTDWLVSTQFDLSNQKDVSCFLVGQLIGGSTNGRMVVLSHGGNDYDNTLSAVLLMRNGTANQLETFFNGNAYALTNVSLSTNYRIGTIVNGDSLTVSFYLNGAIQGSPASLLSTPAFLQDYYCLGRSFNGDGPCQCLISEIVLVNGVMSSGDITNLDNYFVSRWGT